MKRKFLFLFVLLIALAVLSFKYVFATDCWLYDDDESTCNSFADCEYHSDSWGGWCEQKGCWSFYTEATCPENLTGTTKHCTWQSSSDTGWCEPTSCFSFEGTNETACENNDAGLVCVWEAQCHGWGPNVNCPGLNQTECESTTGCMWGMCEEKGCWEYSSRSECLGATGGRGYDCAWDSSGEYCYEVGCWDYSGTNETACENNAEGITCIWVDNYYVHNSCEEPSCWHYDFTNEATCENNVANLNCTWDGSQYCMEEGCWNYNNANTCNAVNGCSWTTSYGQGWCEEVNCWTWDQMHGGDQNTCENNEYGLNCEWNNGWCDVNFTSACSDLTIERDCMDTYYCWWRYTDPNDPTQGGECVDPEDQGLGGTFFEAWNPGCYVFDMNSTNCNKILGCQYAGGVCNVQAGHDYENTILDTGINCTMVNDSTLCKNIQVLATCCEWKGGECIENKMTTRCWDQSTPLPEGIEACADVSLKTSDSQSAKTLCEQISGDPWYLPCEWNNNTKNCDFKSADVFGEKTKSFALIDNQKTCEAAGGMWIVENYCEGNLSVPVGRCERKGSAEKNCNKACFACEYKSDGSAHNSTKAAKEYCYNSKLGYCEFIDDSNAPNSYGFCKAKEQFKKGIATDCTNDCGSCTFMGNPSAANEYSGEKKSYDTCNTPKCYCQQAYEFDNVKCKWVEDTSSPEGGYCVDSSKKTCADACDRCYTQSDCQNVGRSALNATGSCEWEGKEVDGSCTKSGETTEICWDGINNDPDQDDLIDCEDPECYADSFCGFVSGDCFGWTTQTDCENNGCAWMSDPWGSWCDFPGADCWKYDGNETACGAKTGCEWTSEQGDGMCEQDWSMGEDCYAAANEAACNVVTSTNCTWTNDTWCDGEGSGTDWCDNHGGWCDPDAFAAKDCWKYDGNQTRCGEQDGCAWESKDWASCEIDWSDDSCHMYGDQDTCENNDCFWRSGGPGGGYCDNKFQACWDLSTQSGCDQYSDYCYWTSWGTCEAKCFDQSLDSTSCEAITGCRWSTGWCMEDWSTGGVDCWNDTLSNNQVLCDAQAECKWKDPGWCNPKGFSGGDAFGGMGMGAQTGMQCWKYDGTNETTCENNDQSITCVWMQEYKPFCDADWSSECWQYDWNATQCNAQASCQWHNETGENGWCQNLFDQCWSNSTLNSDQTECDNNNYCTWVNNHCEPICFSKTTKATCEAEGCNWMTGWCDPPGMAAMFGGMQMGAPVPIAFDPCDETSIPAYVDLCGAGMKDMGDSYGFGANVRDFSDAGICNQQKMASGYGSGNKTTKLYIYLDTNGNTTGGCALSHDSTTQGYEFMFKYVATWNSTSSKATESFNAYKCGSGTWQAADITLNAWKEKMCSELEGMMVAVKKSDLDKFPSLYNSEYDMRVVAASADADHNASSPSDTAGPGWVTPGAVDFEVKGFFEEDANAAKFEDILKYGFVLYEDCYNGVDDDDDDLIDCDDWECQFASHCAGIGVNAADYDDTSMPRILGVKMEGYPDAALVMYDTNKPTNGTLTFWHTDSTCSSSAFNRTVYDIGILSDNVRDYKMWHHAQIYNDGGVESLDYDLSANTTYYYKIKICDSSGKCSQSACTSLRTAESAAKCGGLCNFVTIIKAPTGWTVYYDLDQDGTYEHIQGQMCGAKAGMKTNYTNGRNADIKLVNSEGGTLWFMNVTLTRSGLSKDTRNITKAGDLIYEDSYTDADGNPVGLIGMIAQTRDKIINNLHPEGCRIRIPSDGTCDELYHCDDSGEYCVDMTDNATLINEETSFCTWQIPYCEFSTWASGEISSGTEGSTSSADTGGGGAGGLAATTTTSTITITPTTTTTQPATTTTTTKPSIIKKLPEKVSMNLEYIFIGIVIFVILIVLILKFGRK